jgi:hypothetical protein
MGGPSELLKAPRPPYVSRIPSRYVSLSPALSATPLVASALSLSSSACCCMSCLSVDSSRNIRDLIYSLLSRMAFSNFSRYVFGSP